MLKDIFRFNGRYFVTFAVLLIVEVFIALYVHDRIVRPYVGNVLIIILMYVLIKSFYALPTKGLPIYLFVFWCVIEVSQLFNLVQILGVGDSRILSVVLGNVFDMKDILCYAVGMGLLIFWEQLLRKNIAYL